MALGDMHQYYRILIDPLVVDLLAVFHKLDEKSAIEALDILSRQEVMPEKATAYAPLPDIFWQERFDAVRDELKKLHIIMQNQRPEGQVRGGTSWVFDEKPDHGPEIHYGIFNLKGAEESLLNNIKRDPKAHRIDATRVRQYLLDQFEVTREAIRIVHAAVVPLLESWKREQKEKNNSSYTALLVEWVDAGEMTDTMKERVLAAIKEKHPELEKYLSPEDYADMDNTVARDDTEEMIRSILKLPANIFENVKNIEAVFMILPTKNSLQSEALKKIKEHIQNPGMPNSLDVCNSFLAAERVYGILHQNKLFLQAMLPEMAEMMDEYERACINYLKQIAEKPFNQQQSFTPDSLDSLILFTQDEAINGYVTLLNNLNSPVDLINFFDRLRADQMRIFLETQPDRVSAIIKNVDNFFYVFEDLYKLDNNLFSYKDRKCIVFLENQLKRSSGFIKTPDDLIRMIDSPRMFKYEIDLIIQHQRDRWFDLVKTSEDFIKIMKHTHFSNYKQTIFNSLKNSLPDFIKNADDFSGIMQNLEDNQRIELLKRMTVPKNHELIRSIFPDDNSFKSAMQTVMHLSGHPALLEQQRAWIDALRAVHLQDKPDNLTRKIQIAESALLTRDELRKMLALYKTRSAFSSHGEHSKTIKKLNKLAAEGNPVDVITTEQINNALLKDSKHRFRLFNDPQEKQNKTATDEMVVQLRKRIHRT